MKKLLVKVLVLTLVLSAVSFCLTACTPAPEKPEEPLHEHAYVDIVVKPTCTEQGYTEHKCSCGESYKDNYVNKLDHKFTNYISNGQGKKVATCDYNCGETNIIDEDHEHNYVTTVVNPTCTKQGYTEHKCSCGESYKDNYVNKLDHKFTNYISNGQGKKIATCDYNCGETNTVDEAHAHNYVTTVVNPTCKTLGYSEHKCSCGDSYQDAFVDKLDHKFTNYIYNNDATCTKDGTKTAYCDYGCKKTDTITATGTKLDHKFTNYITNGDGTKTGTCSYGCGETDTIEDWLTIFTINGSGGTITGLTAYGKSLKKLTIPNKINGVKITAIGESAFSDCSSLQSVVIGDSVEDIGYMAFYNCNSLTTIEIPDSVKAIGESAFRDCLSLQSVVIGDSVKAIGETAFGLCLKLTSVVIPDSVEEIGEDAFEYCSSLQSVVIGDSVKAIGARAFYACNSLQSVVIGDSVTSIGDMVFYNCSSLTSIEVEENNANYKSIDGNLYSKYGKTLIQYAIGKKDAAFTIPDSVEVIGEDAFYYCSSLQSVVIGDSVEDIGKSAFYGCTSLTEIKYNATNCADLMSDNKVFYNAGYSETGIKVTIGSNVKKIPAYLFYDSKVKEVVFEEDSACESIGSSAFINCSKLTSIKYRGTEEAWKAITKGSYWDDNTGNYTITYNYTEE